MDATAAYDRLAAWDDLRNLAREDEEELPATYTDPRGTPQTVLDLTAEISQLEARIAQLKLQSEQLLADQALIRRLPSEVLARVFELGVHGDSCLLPVLSLVSRAWRALALATPVLWSYLRLDHTWGYGRAATFLVKARCHLERAAACKLLVDLDLRFVDALGDVNGIMACLAPHLARCFALRIAVPDWEWMAAVRGAVAPVLGGDLEELHLRLDPSDAEDQVPVTFLGDGRAYPRLRAVVLEHAPLQCISSSVLPSLKRFHLTRDQRYHSPSSRIGVPFAAFLAQLERTPTLQELRVQGVVFILTGFESIFQPAPTRVSLPELRSLSFASVDGTNVSLLFFGLHLPALEHLKAHMELNGDESLHWLSTASSTSLPALRHLDLRGCGVEGAALFSFVSALHALPQLEALALSSPPTGCLGAKLFELLSTPPWILPRLKAFCVQNCRDVSGHEILRFVRARQGTEGVKDLKYVKICQCYAVDDDVVQQLSALVRTVRRC